MTDELVLKWLIGMTTYIAHLHQRIQSKQSSTQTSNAGPRYYEKDVHEAHDEGFARWMGWRGEAAQEEEINAKRKS